MKIVRSKATHQIVKTFFVSTLFLLSACQYDEVLPTEVELPDDPVSYELDIQPIFDGACIQCHGGSISPDLRSGSSFNALTSGNYIDTNAPENSTLYQLLNNLGSSHEGRANPTERALILKWIEEGAIIPEK